MIFNNNNWSYRPFDETTAKAQKLTVSGGGGDTSAADTRFLRALLLLLSSLSLSLSFAWSLGLAIVCYTFCFSGTTLAGASA